jgi:hypothetical protein
MLAVSKILNGPVLCRDSFGPKVLVSGIPFMEGDVDAIADVEMLVGVRTVIPFFHVDGSEL